MPPTGVQIGTRFIATDECDASDVFKDAIINAGKEDILIIKSPVGMPATEIGIPMNANSKKPKEGRPTLLRAQSGGTGTGTHR